MAAEPVRYWFSFKGANNGRETSRLTWKSLAESPNDECDSKWNTHYRICCGPTAITGNCVDMGPVSYRNHHYPDILVAGSFEPVCGGDRSKLHVAKRTDDEDEWTDITSSIELSADGTFFRERAQNRCRLVAHVQSPFIDTNPAETSLVKKDGKCLTRYGSFAPCTSGPDQQMFNVSSRVFNKEANECLIATHLDESLEFDLCSRDNSNQLWTNDEGSMKQPTGWPHIPYMCAQFSPSSSTAAMKPCTTAAEQKFEFGGIAPLGVHANYEPVGGTVGRTFFDTSEKCWDACSQSGTCKMASFDKTKNVCRLYTDRPMLRLNSSFSSNVLRAP